MNPIKFEVKQTIKSPTKKIFEKTLDVATWRAFAGHGIVPGIENAEYLERTDEMTGSRIRVTNSDGTQHLEEVLEWEPGEKIVMKIHDFPATLSFLATHFIEEWEFEALDKNKTLVIRTFRLFPTSFLTRPLLGQIAPLFEKGVAAHLADMAAEYE